MDWNLVKGRVRCLYELRRTEPGTSPRRHPGLNVRQDPELLGLVIVVPNCALRMLRTMLGRLNEGPAGAASAQMGT